MKRKATSRLMLILLLLNVLALAFCIQPVGAEPIPEIYMDPSDNFFFGPLTPVGTKFNVAVWSKSAGEVSMWIVYLTVDDDLLNITGAWHPIADPNYCFFRKSTGTPAPEFHDIDNDGNYEGALIGDYVLVGCCGRSGKLAIIEFAIKTVPPIFEEISCPSPSRTETHLSSEAMRKYPLQK